MEQFPREHNRRQEIDKVAKEGRLIKGDLPGTDTYDDATNDKGELVREGSTTVESGGTYMLDRGPEDGVRREAKDETWADKPGMGIVSGTSSKDDIYAGEDQAAKWLRENDPNFKKAA